MSTGPRRAVAATIADIDAASDEPSLRAGLDGAHAAIAAELAAHTPAITLAAAWSEVLRHSVAAAVRITGDTGRWAWFVSGSVARGEAAPGSDVETLAVLDDTVDDAGKAELLARAAQVHALLERCTVRGDANGVLASRPRFCRRMGSWTEGIEAWTADPRADRGVVMTGLVADSVGISGGVPPGAARLGVSDHALRAEVVAAVGRSRVARQGLLQDATTLRAGFPSRLKMFTSGADTVDLKRAAVDPVVKIARWGALSAGSDAVYTLDRLDAAAAANILDADDAASLRECFEWLLRFRWRHRAGPWLRGERVSDVVLLPQAAPQERAVLRTVAREVAGISRKLTYLASASSFH
ncbi:MAG TPA: putative nucleotidyltransferase substrate binding domain-containing protein [Mycobacterium sp.]|nr:putative nucleotidyltransferase substrate binding domain-containing protein [Mycobacterium sp.]